MSIEHLNPEGMASSPAFSQGVVAAGGRTVYVGGQNGIDADGELVGGLAEQSAQALRNVLTVLGAAGAGPEDVVKLNVYLAPDVDVQAAFAASQEVWGPHPTATTVQLVAGFAREGVLVEIDAVAVIA